MRKASQHGFTLVELIVVMVIMGVLAGILVVFFSPALQNYFATARRAALTDSADGAMRRISRDVRVSVPNSVRIPPIDPTDLGDVGGNQCLEMVPTSAGGRFRTAPDINNSQSMPVEPGRNFTEFDVLTNTAAAKNDWIVIGNQNADDVYNNVNIAPIDSVDSTPVNGLRVSRIKLAGAGMQAPAGYDGARFVVVPAAQGPVTYYCKGVGPPGATTGTGTLYRVTGYGFGGPNTCKARAGNPAIVATHVSECAFRYAPNPGATQESGFVEMDITLREADELVRLTFGVHVDNLP